MSSSLKDKVALLTGAASGIGRATAMAFANVGAKVVVSDISGAADEVAAIINRNGGVALSVRADVSKSEDVRHLVQTTVKNFGRLDVAFNNAGIEGVSKPLAELTEEEWSRTLGVDLTGTFLCMKYEIPELLRAGGGVIVNNASIAGVVGFANSAAYTAAKHGVIGLTKAAALEYAAANIRVNAICPGVIDTPMVTRAVSGKPELLAGLLAAAPIPRMGQPAEIANAVVWMSSAEASFLTGHPMVVDGGYVAR